MIIETMRDIHVEAARIQQEIKDYLGLRTSDMVFEYTTFEGKIKLDLITINPRHNQAFLFHSETGADKVDALRKMLGYVQNYKEIPSFIRLTFVQGTFSMPCRNYTMDAT
jgi:hypothetical protein